MLDAARKQASSGMRCIWKPFAGLAVLLDSCLRRNDKPWFFAQSLAQEGRDRGCTASFTGITGHGKKPSSILTATLSRFLAATFFALLFIAQPSNVQAQADPTDLCSRTTAVQNAIIAKVSGKTDCADITSAELAGINDLGFSAILGSATNLAGSNLKSGDFAGLTGLTGIFSNHNQLTTLPADIFSGLSALTRLRLNHNQLSTLPSGVFADLTSLTTLNLSGNPLPALLPASLFADLPATATITLPTGTTINAAVPTTVAAPSISISTNTVTATVGTAIDPITITNTGGTVVSYTITDANGQEVIDPAGLVFDTMTDTMTGIISGTLNANAEIGTETYTITARNSGGEDTATITVIVNAAPDTTAPDAPVITQPTTPTTDNSITISGTAAAGATVTLTQNGNALATTATADANGAWSIEVTLSTDNNGANSFTATATDQAGNTSGSSNAVTVTLETADTTAPDAPVITQPTTPTTDNSITISGTAAAGATVTLTQNGNALATTATADANGAWSIEVTLSTDNNGANSFTATATDQAGNTSGSSNAVTVTLETADTTVNAPDSLMGASALNDEVLSKLTQGTVASIMTAVSNRIDTLLSTGTPPKASYQLDGQTLQLDNQAQLLGYIRSLKDGSMDWKRVLSNLSLVLPLNTAGNTAAGSGSRHDLGYGSGLSLWAGGDYLSLDGDSDIDWSGDLFSAQFGIDKRIDKHLLLGTMVSWSEGDADYTQDTNTGSYNHQSLSVYPYLGWSNQGNHLWGSVGYGEGELEIEDNSNSNSISSDTRLWSFATGAKAGLSKVPGLSLKGDFLWARTDIDNPLVDNALDARIREQSIDSQRLRLLLEFEHTYGLSGGLLRPLIELGMRYDGGDGDTGIGAILGTGLRYTNGGLTMEGKLHTLLGRDDYREWGVQGTIVLDPGLRGQGLAFSLTPGYGYGDGDGDVGVSGSSQIWQGLPKGPRDQGHQNQNYRGRLQANMGYGFSTSGGGLLTPYGEVRLSNSRYYRLGMRWNPNIPFSLNLFGEHQTGNDSIGNSTGDNNAILLEGQMQF